MKSNYVKIIIYTKVAKYETTIDPIATATQNNVNVVDGPVITTIGRNEDNSADLLNNDKQTTYKNEASTPFNTNQTGDRKNQTIPGLEVESNINFASTSAFYAIIFTIIGNKIYM